MMNNINRVIGSVASHLAVFSLCIMLLLSQSAAATENSPINANDFRKALENAGWKSVAGPDGAIYLYPNDHPYAYLDLLANGGWSDIPPPGSKALSTIVGGLELQGYHPVVEIEFEDGRWEVEAYKHGKLVEFEIHPLSGQMSAVSSDSD